MITIISFYQFIALPNYESLKKPLLDFMHAYEIKGTLIVASEGINGSFAADKLTSELFLSYLIGLLKLDKIILSKTTHATNPFNKAKVKLRKEIVTLGINKVKTCENAGIHLSPEAWQQLLQDPEVIVIDTRNSYEVDLGRFKDAVNPNTENFRNFPHFVEHKLLDKKDKPIAMYCTGGIRCEKSTAYLKSLGFEQVYQLKGGILNYLSTIPKEHSHWQGECFVFDNRITVNHDLQGATEGSIDKEWKNNYRKKLAQVK